MKWGVLLEGLRSRRPLLPRRRNPEYLLLSYPKSGRMWVRFMVDAYLVGKYGGQVRNVFEIEKDPVVRREHRIRYKHFIVGLPYWEMGRFPERKTLVPASHAVLLTRNVYSTLASAYNYVTYRGYKGRKFTGTVSEFLRDPRRGAIKVVTFYNLWLELRSEFRSASVFSYEALKADTSGVFRQMLEALGMAPVDEHLLAGVIEQSSFQRMQALAMTEDYRDTEIAPVDPMNKNSWHIREGKADGFRALFSEDDLAYVQRLVEDLLIDKGLVDLSLGAPTGGRRRG